MLHDWCCAPVWSHDWWKCNFEGGKELAWENGAAKDEENTSKIECLPVTQSGLIAREILRQDPGSLTEATVIHYWGIHLISDKLCERYPPSVFPARLLFDKPLIYFNYCGTSSTVLPLIQYKSKVWTHLVQCNFFLCIYYFVHCIFVLKVSKLWRNVKPGSQC